jgi:hypothetical protein
MMPDYQIGVELGLPAVETEHRCTVVVSADTQEEAEGRAIEAVEEGMELTVLAVGALESGEPPAFPPNADLRKRRLVLRKGRDWFRHKLDKSKSLPDQE